MFEEIERTPFEEWGISFDFDNKIVTVTGVVSFSNGKKLFHTHFEIAVPLDKIKGQTEFIDYVNKEIDKIANERLKILNMLLGG